MVYVIRSSSLRQKIKCTHAHRVSAANDEVRPIHDGEIDRRTRPQATAIFRTERMSAPLPIFRGLRYYIHKIVPSSVFGWLRSLLIVGPSVVIGDIAPMWPADEFSGTEPSWVVLDQIPLM